MSIEHQQGNNIEKKKPKRRIVYFILGILFLCSVCFGITAIFSSSEPEPSVADIPNINEPESGSVSVVESASTEQATPTAEPTNTLRPTATPIPTQTPRPTNTPRPTATVNIAATAKAISDLATSEAVSDVRVSELAYTAEMVEISELYVEALNGLAAQSKLAGEYPTLIFDTDWKTATVIYLAILSTTNDRVRDLEPPEVYREVHDDMLEAASYLDIVIMNYAEGVDEVDPDKLNMAAANMILATEAINRATEKVKDINS